MPLKLAGTIISPSFQTSLVILKELNVPFTHLPVNFAKGEHLLPENLTHHPFGQVPYLLDDDDDGEVFSLYECRAIARYVAVKYAREGQRLVWDWKEDGLKKAGKFEQAASVELNDFQSSAVGIALEAIWRPSGNEALKQFHVANLNKRLDVLDKILAKQRYMAGDDLSLVDFFYLPMGNILQEANINVLEVESRPHLARWWKEMTSRPSWLAVKALM